MENKQPQIWILLTCPEESTYIGNSGYEDQVSEKYLYDDSVPNHLQIKEGDLVVLRDKKYLLGLARIEQIEEKKEKKSRNRCPACNTTKFYPRDTKKPKYRCKKCHEVFDMPNSSYEDCRQFTAYYGNSFISAKVAFSRDELKVWCSNYSTQNAIQLLNYEIIKPILSKKAPQLKRLLSTDYIQDYLKADEAEEENGKNEPEVPYNSITKYYHETIFRQIRARRNQSQFRNALRERYGDQCMITGCKLIDIVEASHIEPYCISNNSHPENGLLLRTDLHTLFDLDLLGIHPESLNVMFHSTAVSAGYKDWEGQTLLCLNLRPSKKALEFRWKRFLERRESDDCPISKLQKILEELCLTLSGL
jgi:hypothetical protein